MSYKIYIDVSVDILPEYVKENNIMLVPMPYSIDKEERICTEIESDEFMHEFYEKLRKGVDSSTSQITPNYYEETFKKEVEEGNGVLYLSLSSGLSNTYSSSILAINNLKEEYDNVMIETVDSLAATGGMGLMLKQAVRNRAAGMSLSDNAEDLRNKAGHVCHWFMVDDLMFLKRGGRVSAATAVIGTALNVKPILKIDDNGKLISISKQRGRLKTVKAIFDMYVASRDEDMTNEVIITHGDCRDDAEKLRDMILEVNPKADVQIQVLSPIIGAHTGPGMLAAIHWGNRNYM